MWLACNAQLKNTVSPLYLAKCPGSTQKGLKSNSDSCSGSSGSAYTVCMRADSLVFQRSASGKEQQKEKTIAPVKNGLSYIVNGFIVFGKPSIACDLSNGEFNGRIYVSWSDEKHGEKDKDVFLIYSDDAGESWTEPILVTYRPNHKEQFMPQVAVDKTGAVNILYYDKQNSADNVSTDIYLAQSKNGGLKFEYYRVNTKAFKFVTGNYKEIKQDTLQLCWSENDGQTHTAVITNSLLEDYNSKQTAEEIQIPRSFTFSDDIKIDFNLPVGGRVSAIITKPLEPGFETWIVKNKKFKKGNNTLIIKPKVSGLQKGNYTLTLYYNNRNTYTWIIDE